MFSKNKATLTVIAIILIASSALMTIPINAQTTYKNLQEGGSIPLPTGITPDLTVATTPFLSFRPNPVGVRQSILINIWLTPATSNGQYLTGYSVTVTKPDGTKDVVGPINSFGGDATAWFEYVVDQVGTWKLKFDFPGGYFPAGNYTRMGVTYESYTQSVYYKPSSTAEQTLTVQPDNVNSWPSAALPTDYWTRPASVDNREWWWILGNYPWNGPGGGPEWPADTNKYSSNYCFTPWVQAPNTAHIVWKRQDALGGLFGPLTGDMIYEAPSLRLGNPSIVYQGRCYQTITKASSTDTGTQTYWMCYDLRTGELYWEKPLLSGQSAPAALEFYAGEIYIPGSAPYLGKTVTLVYIGGGRLIKYDAMTGAVSANVSIAPLTTGTYYMNGYALSVQNLGTGKGYRLINWTTIGTATNIASRVLSNVTWPWSSLPRTVDFETGIAAMISNVSPVDTAVQTTTGIKTASLATGQELCNITVDEAQYSGSAHVADHGKIAILTRSGYYMAWDMRTGNLAWKSEVMGYPWASASFGAYAVQSAYGLIYREAYDGVYAFNWTNGKIVWHYEAPANPYETPYIDETGQTVYPFNAGAIIADGKLYTYNTEHSPISPLTRGWRLHCINATSGRGIWNITGPMTPGTVADGYLTASNSYDGYLYVFGKGKSATTVTAGPKSTTLGEKVLIEGTILDMSPAQSGTPCVSKESMTTQMDYLHMQLPVDGILHNVTMTGVPVSLTTINEKGTYINIGTATTSAYYGTFEMAWTPPAEGTYKIIASFAGDDSYGSSAASTAISVGPAPASTDNSGQQQQIIVPDYTMTIIGVGIAVIIAVALATVIIIKRALIIKKK